jgi:hypothetical protein
MLETNEWARSGETLARVTDIATGRLPAMVPEPRPNPGISTTPGQNPPVRGKNHLTDAVLNMLADSGGSTGSHIHDRRHAALVRDAPLGVADPL